MLNLSFIYRMTHIHKMSPSISGKEITLGFVLYKKRLNQQTFFPCMQADKYTRAHLFVRWCRVSRINVGFENFRCLSNM